ncbi:MAG: TonB-dependent receptor [Flavobacteriales bacterium]|nr:TonB-dependent receptor [Flavobacteriales bacterium]
MSFTASAQVQDSVLHFTKGNIAEKTFSVQEILVRPTCACVGACSCPTHKTDNYSENRFLSSDAILAKNSSISLIKRGNFASEPVLNGMASDRLNLTIDGMKIFGACTDKMDPVTSYVEPNNLKSVYVEHGSSGSMFGSSLGGSVNMETNGAVINAKKPWSGEVGAGFQSAALGANGLLSLNYSRKKWAIGVNGMYRRFQNYRAGGGDIVDHSQFEKWNGALSAKYMPTERDVLRFDMIMDEAYHVGYPALPMDVAFAKAKIFGLTYQHYPQKEWIARVEAKLYANTVTHSMDDTQRSDVIMHMDMPGWTTTFGGHLDGQFIAKKHRMTARLDGYHSNARAEMTMYPDNEAPMFMLTWPDVDKLDLGIYFQDDITLNIKHRLSFNARLDFVSTNVTDPLGVQQASVFNQDVAEADQRVLKNASISYRTTLGKGWTAWVTAGYAERAPSTTEQYAFYIFNAYDGFDHIGDVNVTTEKALQGSAGIRLETGKVVVSATGFYYHIYDYILSAIDSSLDAMTIGANGVKKAENLPSAMLAGGNLSVEYTPIRSLTFRTTGAYTYGSTDAGLPLPLITPFRNVTSVKWTVGRASVSAECESAAPQTRTNPDFGERATAAYAIVNLRAGYYFPFGDKRLSLNGGIENLLDTRYRTHLDWGGIPRPGINGYLNISFTF